jgi:signal transduction histidine kinase
MRRLNYLQKFLLLAFLVLIPLLLVITQYRDKAIEDITFSRKEQIGLAYLEPVNELLRLFHHYFVLAPNVVAIDDPELTEAFTQLGRDITTAIAAVDAVDKAYGEELEMTSAWGALKSDWYRIQPTFFRLPQNSRNNARDTIVRNTLRLITRVGNKSNLILDPDIDSYYYMNATVTKLPTLSQYLGIINATATEALVNDGLGVDDSSLLTSLDESIEFALQTDTDAFAYVFEFNPPLREVMRPQLEAHVAAVNQFIGTMESQLLGRSSTFSAGIDRRFNYRTPGGFYQAAADTIDKTFAFRSFISRELNTLLQVRIDQLVTQSETVYMVARIALLVAAYLIVGFYLNVRQTINQLTEATNHMIKGDKDWMFEPNTRDELAEVAVSFNQIATELVAARDQALESARAKSSFLANMSHELRTPLNAILGFTGILSSGMVKGGAKLEPPQVELLHRIESNGKRLRDVINDILDLAKIESGHITITSTEARPRLFLEETIGTVKSLAMNKGIALELIIEKSAPEVVLTDVRKVHQIVVNLIGNAVKFTHKGGVYVEVSGAGGAWRIAVRDTGIGIPPEALKNIFEKFRQVDETDRREYEGTGLGLAIVKNLADALQGSVHVSSVPQQGSTFSVTLPLRLEVKEV